MFLSLSVGESLAAPRVCGAGRSALFASSRCDSCHPTPAQAGAMADMIFGSGSGAWVCPNDRQLALRAK